MRHRLVALGHPVLFAPAQCLVHELLAAKCDPALPRQLGRVDNFDLLLLDSLGYLPQSAAESEVPLTFIAERYEHRRLGITSNLALSEWERIIANPMAIAAATDRVVHRFVISEFDVPTHTSDAAHRRGHEQELNLQHWSTYADENG